MVLTRGQTGYKHGCLSLITKQGFKIAQTMGPIHYKKKLSCQSIVYVRKCSHSVDYHDFKNAQSINITEASLGKPIFNCDMDNQSHLLKNNGV